MRGETRPLAILGGSGFLGAHVVARALAHGEPRVVSLAREPFAQPRGDDPRLERVACDLLDDEACERALERLRPARIVLCAALSRLADCEADPGRALRMNAALPGRIAMWAREHGARLVFVSTDLVFGGVPAPMRGWSEDASVAPVSRYGDSKAAGEAAVAAYSADAVVARLPLLFGDSFDRALGASDSLLAALARGERPLLFEDEWRTPLDVTDAADALLELAANSFRGVLHVAGPERVDRVRLAVLVLRARGFNEIEARAKISQGTRASLGMDSTRPADVALDTTLARKLLAVKLRGVTEALTPH